MHFMEVFSINLNLIRIISKLYYYIQIILKPYLLIRNIYLLNSSKYFCTVEWVEVMIRPILKYKSIAIL